MRRWEHLRSFGTHATREKNAKDGATRQKMSRKLLFGPWEVQGHVVDREAMAADNVTQKAPLVE